jgi:hypothetical protein
MASNAEIGPKDIFEIASKKFTLLNPEGACLRQWHWGKLPTASFRVIPVRSTGF